MTTFDSLNLADPLKYALTLLEYDKPTPIQAQAIPIVMEGHDLMGLAQTGTGKTAAFALPALNHLCRHEGEPPKKGTRVLILAPTRELVGQIADSVRSYGRIMPHLSVSTVFGGVPISRQIKRLSGGCDIIVATPGRLIDLLDRGSLKLDGVEMLVLDEADQMMDMGFIHALKKIIPLLPKERQTLLFSATMVPKIKRLAEQFLTEPKRVSVTPPNSTADKVEQRATFAEKTQKLGLLGLCLLEPDVTRAIVFTRTKHGADRVVKNLRNIGIDSRAIHGNKSQAQRHRALEAFRGNDVNVLVATDVAARGIDIPEVSHVFNYEIPNVPEQYVHRIGRTARANLSGVAHAFIASDEKAYLKDIQKLLKMDIPKIDLPENFEGKVRALKSRPALPAPAKPEPQARKGRGKGRSKSKPNDGTRKGKPRSDRSRQDKRGKDNRHTENQSRGGETQTPRNGVEQSQNEQPKSKQYAVPKTAQGKTDKPQGEHGFRRRVRQPNADKKPAGESSNKPRQNKPRQNKSDQDKPNRDNLSGADNPYKKAKPSRARRKAARAKARGETGGSTVGGAPERSGNHPPSRRRKADGKAQSGKPQFGKPQSAKPQSGKSKSGGKAKFSSKPNAHKGKRGQSSKHR